MSLMPTLSNSIPVFVVVVLGKRRLDVGIIGMAGPWAKRGDNATVITVKNAYSMLFTHDLTV